MIVGIVGQGFVGSAIREGLKDFHDVVTYDIKPEIRNCDSLEALVEKSRIIFACVPTPMRRDGKCDTRLISSVVNDIDKIVSIGITGGNGSGCVIEPVLGSRFREELFNPVAREGGNASGINSSTNQIIFFNNHNIHFIFIYFNFIA